MAIKLYGAFYTKILVKSESRKNVIEFSPQWWDRERLINSYPFEEKYKYCLYTYRFMTTIDILVEINQLNRKNINEGVFAYSGWQQVVLPELERIDNFLKLNIAEPLQVCIELIQWESGY